MAKAQMNWMEMAAVGRIARAHGNRGQVIVNPDTDFPEDRFQVGADVFTERGHELKTLRVTSVRLHQGRPVVGFEGVETMNDAEALAGLELRVPRERLKPLPEGSYYHHDLVGCQVETASGQVVGVVKSVDTSYGGSRLVVEGASGEVLVPLVTEICRTVDPAAKMIVIVPPDGLLGLNERSA